MKLRVFGVRHHGPGSALRLLNVLNEYQPDCVLIESPFETNSQIPILQDEAIIPPIALLIYEEKALSKAAYLPFAHFSPEWQAIQYALKQEIPVQCIDLPMANQMALVKEDALISNIVNESSISRDPLGYLADLQGYDDSEQWWNDTFEESDKKEDIFPAINELISTIRREANREESRETLLREAFMRKQIRRAIKEGFERIAVVCGAWHAPVLQETLSYKVGADNSILRGLPKTKVKATWIPWSYERLSKIKGYGAGILSPAWYELLFSFPSSPDVIWMSKVSVLMRENGYPASPAHSTEAIRLAQTLATMRDKHLPGLNELDEAALVVFCRGESSKMEVIRKQLIIGNKVGYIPPNLTNLPIQKDFFKLIKSTRLSRYWEKIGKYWLKATATNSRGGLDLRNSNDLLKSHFLHQLNVLEVSWGTVMDKTGLEKGSFKEFWQLNWDALFTLQVIEAGKWGNTIQAAAQTKIVEDANKATHLKEVAILMERALKGGLQAAIRPLTDKMTTLLSETEDCLILMESFPTFINILEYGDVRQTDLLVIEHYISEIIPRICIELPGYCHHLDEEQSKKVLTQIVNTNAALKILDNEDFLSNWNKTLALLSDVESIAPEPKGIAARLLFDQNEDSIQTTGRRMSLALSDGNEPIQVVRWLEGFLHGSGLLLVHFRPLWRLIDDWVIHVREDSFHHILPLLRRTFSNFSPSERSKMMQMAQSHDSEESNTFTPPINPGSYSNQREKILLPMIKKLLSP